MTTMDAATTEAVGQWLDVVKRTPPTTHDGLEPIEGNRSLSCWGPGYRDVPSRLIGYLGLPPGGAWLGPWTWVRDEWKHHKRIRLQRLARNAEGTLIQRTLTLDWEV